VHRRRSCRTFRSSRTRLPEPSASTGSADFTTEPARAGSPHAGGLNRSWPRSSSGTLSTSDAPWKRCGARAKSSLTSGVMP
jgi:hypothetical protein